MSHTKEPWISMPGGRFDRDVIITTQDRVDQSYGEICSMDVEFTGKMGNEQKANARRIVACVNACAGISTENLQDNLPVNELARRYNVVLGQRELLLMVIRQFKQADNEAQLIDAMDRANEIMADIASVEGGAA